ncbi:defender against death DAD protein [Venturia nashicola]|uniref:Dolichyl-diphosphooligosaccharide--protein glycosyltransferase subunit OST2 n=1 Tax=Venturia nashicola TaxID=86259 RepID=A0A4Z1P8M1_9PEZI|nr:defender against death DAD protein [Venturia nashicola]TLD26339.1 defender against death DAD protein [Venturia nashicola]
MPPRKREQPPATSTSVAKSTPPTSRPSTSSKKTSSSAQQIVDGIWKNYVNKTPQRVKLLDAFMAFLAVVGALQFVYCVIVGNFPFNAFLAGFSSTVGQFVLTASLRMQTNPENREEFKSISDERAFADFIFGSMLLHFFCVNFIN